MNKKLTQAPTSRGRTQHDDFLSSLWTSKDKIPTNSTTNEFVNMHADKLNPEEY